MVVVPIWKREIITRHLLNWYNDFDFQLVVVGSEGEKSRQLANGLYLEAPNYPLDAKYDSGIQHCKLYNPDAVALVGSDDFITGDYFEWAMSQISLGFDMVGLLDFYLADLTGNKIFYWGGYTGERSGDAIGAGRVYSKSILDRLDWKPFGGPKGCYDHIFKDDERSEDMIRVAGGKIKSINMANIGCRYWAVKTGNEINPIEAFHKAYNLVDITPNALDLMELDLKIEINRTKSRYLLC